MQRLNKPVILAIVLQSVTMDSDPLMSAVIMQCNI